MKKKVQIDDFAAIKKIGSLTMSPSHERTAFTVTEASVKDNRYLTDIWVYDQNRVPCLFRLTSDGNGKAPIFLDDETIIFTGDRKKNHKPQPGSSITVVNKISLGGGEAEEWFTLPFSASSFHRLSEDSWLCAGTRKLTTPDLSSMSEEEKKDALALLEEEKDYEVFDELPFWFNGKGNINKVRTGLFLCNIKEGTQRLLTEPLFDMHGFTVSDDGRCAVYWGDFFDSLDPMKSRMYIRDLTDDTEKEVALNGRYSVHSAQFTGDEIMLTATTGERYGTSENEGFYLLNKDGTFSLICEPDISFGAVGSDIAGGGSNYTSSDGINFIRTNNYRSDYVKMRKDGELELILDDIEIISAAVGEKDNVVFTGMEKDRPQELYHSKNGKTEKISSFNEEYVSEREIACTKHFTFTDSDSVEIDGWVLYPADFDEKKKYPAILSVHGGPRAAYGEGFFHEMQYWAGLGYIVFFCNPRGSSGKGDRFADIFGEHFGVRDYNDIMEFTDEVLRRVPQIDVSRIAMTGGSYGGFMANWIIGHTDRFAAVASCRSISNYISKCLTTDIGFYHNLSQMHADPWSSPEKMWEHSPLAYADKAVTPTLFIQSDEDYRCWMGDAVQMLQALLMHGVPARMCLFHGENHELSRSGKPKHRVRRIKEITDWFDKYLGRS